MGFLLYASTDLTSPRQVATLRLPPSLKSKEKGQTISQPVFPFLRKGLSPEAIPAVASCRSQVVLRDVLQPTQHPSPLNIFRKAYLHNTPNPRQPYFLRRSLFQFHPQGSILPNLSSKHLENAVDTLPTSYTPSLSLLNCDPAEFIENNSLVKSGGRYLQVGI